MPEWKAGDTVSFIGKVKFRGEYQGAYGRTVILTFHTEEGYYIKWFSSSFDAKKGDVIKVEKAKVKSVENDNYLKKMVVIIKATSATKAYDYDPSVHTKEFDDIQKELPKLLKKDKQYQKDKDALTIIFQNPPLITQENSKNLEEKIKNLLQEIEEKHNNETDLEKRKNYFVDTEK